jgi:outer membrane protein
MKKLHSSLFALTAFAALALVARAQPAPQILVVDIAKVFENHYEKQEKEAQLRNDVQKANDEMERMNKEGNALVEQYKNLVDQSKNPALTPEAQAKADADSKKKMDEIKSKENDLNNFKEENQRTFQQRIQNIRNALVDEITRTASDVAKRHGATLLFDKSGVSALLGNGLLVYSDPAYDITDEVIKEVNKDRPPPAGGPGATPTAPESDTPKVTLPGLTPKS